MKKILLLSFLLIGCLTDDGPKNQTQSDVTPGIYEARFNYNIEGTIIEAKYQLNISETEMQGTIFISDQPICEIQANLNSENGSTRCLDPETGNWGPWETMDNSGDDEGLIRNITPTSFQIWVEGDGQTIDSQWITFNKID